MRLIDHIRAKLDNAKPAKAYLVQYGGERALMLLLSGDKRNHVRWYGSRFVRVCADDRSIADLWLVGATAAPIDGRTVEVPIKELRL